MYGHTSAVLDADSLPEELSVFPLGDPEIVDISGLTDFKSYQTSLSIWQGRGRSEAAGSIVFQSQSTWEDTLLWNGT